MLYDKKNIPELSTFYHRNDDNKQFVDYESSLLEKSLSPYLYGNDIMSSFLKQINQLISIFFDMFNITKNWRNFTVDKYYYKHTN